MVGVEERGRIRRAYFIEKKSIRRIAREYRHNRRVMREALKDSGVPVYRRKRPSVLPVIGPYVPMIEQWLLEDESRKEGGPIQSGAHRANCQ